jgi:5-oxoprolinase (ATP-hydrolysing)
MHDRGAARQVMEELAAQGIGAGDAAWRPKLQIRYDGTDTALSVDFSQRSLQAARRDFEAAHKAQFGFVYEDKPLVVEAVEVEGRDGRALGLDEPEAATADVSPAPPRHGPVHLRGRWRGRPASSAARRFRPASRISGPALDHRESPDDRRRARLGRHRSRPSTMCC